MREQTDEWYLENKDKPEFKLRRQIYNAEHKEEAAAYRLAHQEESRIYHIAYGAAHRSERLANQRSRRANDLNHGLACGLRERLNKAIRNGQKAGSAVRDLGCSIEHLKLHLELFWDEGMNWANYGNRRGQWSIDHIKPVTWFDLTDRAQFLEANHYMNLQPLWQDDNTRKGNRLPCQ